jgi:hypothetical protein
MDERSSVAPAHGGLIDDELAALGLGVESID